MKLKRILVALQIRGGFFPFIILWFLMMQSTAGFSDPVQYLNVSGWVIKDEKPLGGAVVSVYESDTLTMTTKTGFLGGFALFLPFQKEYTLTFRKDNLITKKITIDTRTESPPDPNEYYQFQFEVELLPLAPSLFAEYYLEPVSVVFFDDQKQDFSHRRNTLDDFVQKSQRLLRDGQDALFRIPATMAEGLMALSNIGNLDKMKLSEIDSLIADFAEHNPVTEEEREQAIASINKIDEYNFDSVAETSLNPSDEAATSDPFTENLPETSQSESTLKPKENKIEADPSFTIRFFYLDDTEFTDPSKDVFFSVQVLATKVPMPARFFTKLKDNYTDEGIYYYNDSDKLQKFIVGTYDTVDQALDMYRQIRNLGYEGYIVAFHDSQRIRVKEARQYLLK